MNPMPSLWHNKPLISLIPNGFETAKNLMTNNNPVFIPRNHQVEKALSRACGGDFSDFEALLKILQTPYIYDHGTAVFWRLPARNLTGITGLFAVPRF